MDQVHTREENPSVYKERKDTNAGNQMFLFANINFTACTLENSLAELTSVNAFAPKKCQQIPVNKAKLLTFCQPRPQLMSMLSFIERQS